MRDRKLAVGGGDGDESRPAGSAQGGRREVVGQATDREGRDPQDQVAEARHMLVKAWRRYTKVRGKPRQGQRPGTIGIDEGRRGFRDNPGVEPCPRHLQTRRRRPCGSVPGNGRQPD